MMRKVLIVMSMLCCMLAAEAKIVKTHKAGSPVVTDARPGSGGVFTLVIDSIDYRPDLTRVYCHINGTPNTAQRIDAVTLTNATRALAATDIDGVEMKHYFQFEEDGTLALEIDFAPTSVIRRGSISFVTPLGTYTYNIK